MALSLRALNELDPPDIDSDGEEQENKDMQPAINLPVEPALLTVEEKKEMSPEINLPVEPPAVPILDLNAEEFSPEFLSKLGQLRNLIVVEPPLTEERSGNSVLKLDAGFLREDMKRYLNMLPRGPFSDLLAPLREALSNAVDAGATEFHVKLVLIDGVYHVRFWDNGQWKQVPGIPGGRPHEYFALMDGFLKTGNSFKFTERQSIGHFAVGKFAIAFWCGTWRMQLYHMLVEGDFQRFIVACRRCHHAPLDTPVCPRCQASAKDFSKVGTTFLGNYGLKTEDDKKAFLETARSYLRDCPILGFTFRVENEIVLPFSWDDHDKVDCTNDLTFYRSPTLSSKAHETRVTVITAQGVTMFDTVLGIPGGHQYYVKMHPRDTAGASAASQVYNDPFTQARNGLIREPGRQLQNFHGRLFKEVELATKGTIFWVEGDCSYVVPSRGANPILKSVKKSLKGRIQHYIAFDKDVTKYAYESGPQVHLDNTEVPSNNPTVIPAAWHPETLGPVPAFLLLVWSHLLHDFLNGLECKEAQFDIGVTYEKNCNAMVLAGTVICFNPLELEDYVRKKQMCFDDDVDMWSFDEKTGPVYVKHMMAWMIPRAGHESSHVEADDDGHGQVFAGNLTDVMERLAEKMCSTGEDPYGQKWWMPLWIRAYQDFQPPRKRKAQKEKAKEPKHKKGKKEQTNSVVKPRDIVVLDDDDAE
jgi:hypothetical protein